jgi:hypothetical protein
MVGENERDAILAAKKKEHKFSWKANKRRA